MSKSTYKDIFLFVLFYYISTVVYYTASWISWGGFKPGHPPYFHIEEFFAAGGAQFTISFVISSVIWYITSVLMQRYSLKTRLLSHLVFLPLYITLCYFLLLWTTKIFGWAMYWGGYKVIWTLYIFMLFYLVQFGFIHAYSYWKKTQKDLKEKALLKEMALQSEIVALKSQLNPHFLHNLFNSIVATIPVENENTRELIVKLSDLFRYQNYASQHDFVTIGEELDFIRKYLELMKVRLKDRLNYSIVADHLVLRKSIAPMLLQPLVENAVIHGIATKTTPSNLKLEVTTTNHGIHFLIADTGEGMQSELSSLQEGMGLSNTKMRLQKIYNTELTIKKNIPQGTKIAFTI